MPSLTLTYTAGEATRIAAAVQHKLKLSAPATGAEVKAWISADLIQLVNEEEAAIAREGIVSASPIAPT